MAHVNVGCGHPKDSAGQGCLAGLSYGLRQDFSIPSAPGEVLQVLSMQLFLVAAAELVVMGNTVCQASTWMLQDALSSKVLPGTLLHSQLLVNF